MALINCPDCSRPVSDQANSCINCGKPIKTSKLLVLQKSVKHKTKDALAYVPGIFSQLCFGIGWLMRILLVWVLTFLALLSLNSGETYTIATIATFFVCLLVVLVFLYYHLYFFYLETKWNLLTNAAIGLSGSKMLFSMSFRSPEGFFATPAVILLFLTFFLFFAYCFLSYITSITSSFFCKSFVALFIVSGYFILVFNKVSTAADVVPTGKIKKTVNQKVVPTKSVSTKRPTPPGCEFDTVADADEYEKLLSQGHYLKASKKALPGSNAKKKSLVLYKQQIAGSVPSKLSQKPDLFKLIYNSSGRFTIKDIKSALNSEVNVNSRSKKGWSPLMVAAAHRKDLNILELLLEAGAEINVSNNNGLTPLMAAAYFNSNPDVIKTLLEAGADPLLKSNKRGTALDYLRCNKKMKNSKAYNLLLYQTLSPKNRKSKS
jgi:hypothetical protein